MSQMNQNRFWVPLVSFGPYYFGMPIDSVGVGLIKLEEECNEWGDTYKETGDDEIRIYTENGKITEIAEDEEFIYKNKNLIGVSIDELIENLGIQFDRSTVQEIIEERQVLYSFDSLALGAWGREGIIVSIQCGQRIEED